MLQHSHHAAVTPSFSKNYGNIGEQIQLALNQYKSEVSNREFPNEKYSPYTMPQQEAELFKSVLVNELKEDGIILEADLNSLTKKKNIITSTETIKVY